MEVLRKRATLDGGVAVAGEGTGKDRDVAEGTLSRLVEDVCENEAG